MQLTEHRNENQLFIRKADGGCVRVIDRDFNASLIVGATSVVDDCAPRSVAELDDAAIGRILTLQPAVVLLGTGERTIFPPQRVLGEFLRRGIGVEAMDNAAAARTFNVLVGEGRNAVAVFLIGA
jgi:uncharacterized protein